MLSGMRARRIDPGPLLDARGLPRSLLAGPARRLSIEDYAALYNAVVARLDDEGFGLFPAPVPRGTFEFLCRSVLSSATLGEALDRAARFLRLVIPDLAVSTAREGPQALLEIRELRPLQARPDDPRRVFAFEWLLRLLHGLACWLAARAIPLEAVAFPFRAPPHAPEYARIYAPLASFGEGHLAARFDAAFLAAPVRRDEAELARFLEGAPGRISMLYRPDRGLARAVREWMAGHLPLAPRLDDVARDLHLSTRTLHRRLREEGTSFRELRESLRRELALDWLGRGKRNVAATAAALGYSEPSAFFRAFQKWTGEAPSRYRRRHRPA